MAVFNGQLKANEIFGSIYNMIISQEVFSENLKGVGSRLVDEAKVDAGLYGDTKLYYSTDVLSSHDWDLNDTNVLETHRPKDPKVQAITLDKFRQIALTVDNYMTKRAWSDEYAFSQFNSIMLSWIRNTKRLYDSTTYNTYIGTVSSQPTKCNIVLDLTTLDSENTLDKAKLEGMTIAKQVADVFTDLSFPSREFNEYGFMRSYNNDDFKVVWNSEFVNKIRKVDLPTIFNNEGLIDKFNEYVLPKQYFGKINDKAGTVPANNKSIRALVEKEYEVSNVKTNVFPGELLPSGASYLANETYTEDPKVICKILHRKSVPFMSSFEVETNFYNPKALNENHYLTWGHNTLEYLKEFPLITLKIK